eukprot:1335836-Amorphochlora_amoeboformis.AAC.1
MPTGQTSKLKFKFKPNPGNRSPTAPVNIPGSEESSEKRSGTWEKEGKGGKNPAREEGKREATDLAAK